MRALVTGAAGFIGSHLLERCCELGLDVVGIDSFTDYYDESLKRANLNEVRERFPSIEVVQADVLDVDLRHLLDGVDVVFHQAGQPGVRASWGTTFESYLRHNVLATQRLLEACRSASVSRLVYASSSSIYGNAPAYPTSERDLPCPVSPYGVTKLAAEHLCSLYAHNFGLPTVSLRYFTVYGPRQRPDMATHRLIRSALTSDEFCLFGDGSKIRDFTYVSDVVAANLAAATADIPVGSVFNIAGGTSCTMLDLIASVASAVGAAPRVIREADAVGDVKRTGGSTDRALEQLGWRPEVGLDEGVSRQAGWMRQKGDAT